MDEHAHARETDDLQERIADLACGLQFGTLPADDREAAIVRVADSFAALVAGFDSSTARRARALAGTRPHPGGATVMGAGMKVAPEMAAFVNATTSREAEWNDVYMSRAGGGTHPSDVVMPILAAAEHAGTDGATFLAGVVIAYEIYVSLSDVASITGFDQAGLAGIGVAAAAGRVMGLSRDQILQAISIAAVANNPLNQSRRNDLSMWKAAAAGQAGMAGVLAAVMAQHGMEGPSMPFRGAAGWCTNIARNAFDLPALDPAGSRFRIRDTQIKPRASCQVTISSILAAEAAAGRLPEDAANADAIAHVLVETYGYAKRGVGSAPQCWNPLSRESADHSIPYVVSAALIDGTVGPRQFQDDRLWDPQIRRLLPKVEVRADDGFSAAYDQHPRKHHTRVTVELVSGQQIQGETGGPLGDLGDEPTRSQLERKFLDLTESRLGEGMARSAMERLLNIESVGDVGEIAALLSIDGSEASKV